MATLSELFKKATEELKKKAGISAEEARAMIATAVSPVQQQAADNSAKIQELVAQVQGILDDETADDEKVSSIETVLTDFANAFVPVEPPAPEPTPEATPEPAPEPEPSL